MITSPVREIASDSQTEIVKYHTRPFRVVHLHTTEDEHFYYSQGPEVTISSNVYLEGRVYVPDIVFSGDAGVEASIFLEAADDSEDLFFDNSLIEATCYIYEMYRKDNGDFTTPELLAIGMVESAEFDLAGITLSLVQSRASVQFIPNRFFSQVTGFNYLPPEGTIIQFNGSSYVLEGIEDR